MNPDQRASSSSAAERISVVIPAYNAERFLHQAMESVFAQTRPADEIIVVNDGSTDRTADILTSYGNRIRVIHQENAGLPAARNRGLREATGEWIAFLDADDTWDSDRLEVGLSAADSSTCFIHSNARSIDADGAVLSDAINPSDHIGEPTFCEMLQANRVLVLTTLIRRSVILDAGGFDERNPCVEDWQLWLAMMANGVKLKYLPRPMASYRIHSQNMSADRDRMAEGELYDLQWIHRRYPKMFTRDAETIYRQRMYRVAFDAAWHRMVRGELAGAGTLFRLALRYHRTGPKLWLYALLMSFPVVRRGVFCILQPTRRTSLPEAKELS